MIKAYRYFFYCFLKFSEYLESHWPRGLRSPFYTANLLLSIYVILLVFPWILILSIGEEADWKVGIFIFFPPISIFIINYFFVIRSGVSERDKNDFDNLDKKVKKLKNTSVFSIILLTIVFCFISSIVTVNKRNEKMFFLSKKVTAGLTSRQVVDIMSLPTKRYLNFENTNDSIYYYRFSFEDVNGFEVFIDIKTNKVKRFRYM